MSVHLKLTNFQQEKLKYFFQFLGQSYTFSDQTNQTVKQTVHFKLSLSNMDCFL